MTRSDRMLAILLELQRKGVVRAEDLARRFEMSVRTVYREYGGPLDIRHTTPLNTRYWV